ncbi:glycosyltransferase family 4 protein [Chitinophaga sedimenti]|uniref:glycosyltransferase family 4 protein n=1 Tax=Chitinophaga sedimenti TaxID=2033606 RepID=UPI003556127D
MLFLGMVHDVSQLMASADINILCSDYEGLSGVTLEAMRCKRPFIGSRVPGIMDVVGTSQCLFDNKPESVAIKIRQCLDDVFCQEVIAANSRKIKEYSLEYMIDNYYELYKNLI